jgi:hypothetical protein
VEYGKIPTFKKSIAFIISWFIISIMKVKDSQNQALKFRGDIIG